MCKFLTRNLPWKGRPRVIPRVARSGQSFDGAGQYYLHDKLESQQRLSTDPKHDFNRVGNYALHDKDGRQTAHRVGFTAMLNMEAETPEQAIGQMTASYERYREREKNKRGRKLTKPVYVYSLSWAPDQTPTQDEMMSAAHSSLKALRLEGLQTLIVQHTDEPHPHIHVIVNRIEPDGSRARNVAFDQLRFSRWAEQYERDHGGIRCEQRVENNALRRKGVMVKDTVSLTRTEYEARERVQRAAQEQWRKDQEAFQKQAHASERSDLWQKQSRERAALEAKTEARIKQDRVAAKEKFKPQWRTLYQNQDRQTRVVAQANKGGIFERACFVFSNREFLAKGGKLRTLDVFKLCLSPKALTQRVRRVQQGERKALGQWEQKLSDGAVRISWQFHLVDLQIMRARHRQERANLDYVQKYEVEHAPHRQAQPEPVKELAPKPAPAKGRAPEPVPAAPTLQPGKDLAPQEVQSLLSDAPDVRKEFTQSANPTNTRESTEAFKARMEEFRRRHPNRDLGRTRRR